MFPIQAPIKLNDRQEVVANLQDTLIFLAKQQQFALDPTQLAELQQERQLIRYGEATGKTIIRFQEKVGLPQSGEVDEQTAIRLNRLLTTLDGRRLVKGEIRTAQGKPIPNATVVLYDKKLRKEVALDKTTSNDQGAYFISYAWPKNSKSPNLLLKQIGADGAALATAKVVFEAAPEVTINLVGGDQVYRGRSKYERLRQEIQAVIDEADAVAPEAQKIKQIAALVEDDKVQDVSFLRSQTHHPPDLLAHMVLADRHAQASGIEAEIFYGWLRQGLPPEASALLAQEPEILRSALQQASNDNIIPPVDTSDDTWKSILKRMDAWRSNVALEDGPDPKQLTLGKLVKTALPNNPQKQKAFTQALAAHKGDIDAFWTGLASHAHLGADAPKLKLAVQVANLGQNHLPLVAAILRTSQRQTINDLAELNEEGWLAILNQADVGVPDGVAGEDDAAKKRTYARQLLANVEVAAPTPFFRARLKESRLPFSTDLGTFLDANPTFDIKTTRFVAYEKANPTWSTGLTDVPATKEAVRTLQRLYRLAPNFKAVTGLYAAKQHSAQSISRMGENAFVKKFSGDFATPVQAKATYQRAQQVSNTALAVLADVNPNLGRAPMQALLDVAPTLPTTDPLNWQTLFGTLDFCSCDDCQSVYGPAAYLVDLLHFLADREADPAQPNSPSVKDVLFERRPDLGELELTCENTNIVLPYVDLLLEILEDAVAPFAPISLDPSLVAVLDTGSVTEPLHQGFGGVLLSSQASLRIIEPGQWWLVEDQGASYRIRLVNGQPWVEARSYQTRGDQQERAANPQFVNQAAYDQLASAIFPLSLPFDQPLAEARIYLDHLGVARRQLMEAFAKGEREEILNNPALAHEWLGLSAGDAALIAPAAPPAKPWLAWGFTDADQATWVSRLSTVDEFLRRSELSYRQLLDLVQTQFVNGNQPITITPTAGSAPDTCDTSKLQLTGLTADHAMRIAQFIRLWRRLDWSLLDLDRAVLAFGGTLDATLLVKLAQLVRLQQHLNLSVRRLLAFWADLDTVRYIDHDRNDKAVLPAHYDLLFRNPATLNPINPAFPIDLAKLRGSLSDQIATIAAALQISSIDLALLQSKLNLLATNDKLNLANLSQLYRHSTLCKALRLAMGDYLRAIDLLGDPFSAAILPPLTTLLFVEKVRQVNESGLRFADLDYLLRHQSATQSRLAIEERTISEHLSQIRQTMQKGGNKDAIVRQLAERFGLSITVIQHPQIEPGWQVFADPAFATANSDITPDAHPQQFANAIFLHKLAQIISHFRISDEMVAWLLQADASLGLFALPSLLTADLATPPVNLTSWLRMVDLLALRDGTIQGEAGLLTLLTLAGQQPTDQQPAPTQAQILAKVGELTTWNQSDLATATNYFAFTMSNDWKSEKALVRLRTCFALLQRLGISAQQALDLSEATVTADDASAIKQAARAHYDEATWAKVARPLRDELREQQRAALVAYLTATTGKRTNELYGHYLIDLEMSPCMLTSRLKQAISSVQLFVQRCLLNLESDVKVDSEQDEAWGWWKWMKSYRVWEANRKVFFYPENWIEPELRDDKSPFFKELESQLLESDLTLESAEAAFRTYLEKLDQVAQLDVMAVYHQTENNSDILHVFARTQAPPRVYFYRQRVNAAYWTAWEKIDLDIEGDHLIPVYWNDRLYLFWPTFTEKAHEVEIVVPNGNEPLPKPKKYWEMKLAWSERKKGKWTGKKISSNMGVIDGITSEPLDLSQVYFEPIITGSDLQLKQRFQSLDGGGVKVVSYRADINDFGQSGNSNPDFADDQIFVDPDTFDPGPVDPDPMPEGVVQPIFQNNFKFFGCKDDPSVTPLQGLSPMFGGVSRSYMFFAVKEQALKLPINDNLAYSQLALSKQAESCWLLGHGANLAIAQHPFFFQDNTRCFLVLSALPHIYKYDLGSSTKQVANWLQLPTTNLDASGNNSNQSVSLNPAALLAADSFVRSPFELSDKTSYQFRPFYHPHVCTLIGLLNRRGLDQMFQREVQRTPHKFSPSGQLQTPFDFKTTYKPAACVRSPYPTEEIDFGAAGAYAQYNWELFFHAPLLIADRLTKNQRFEEAIQWFHYIFNPTDTSTHPSPQRYWQTKEFFEKSSVTYQRERLDQLLKLLANADASPGTPISAQEARQRNDLEAAIKAWRDNPFKPHLVARTRTTAYQKTVVMKYIDTLLAWGDQLFRRDTIESINQATQLYILAAEILGSRPAQLPRRVVPVVASYNTIEQGGLGALSLPLVEIEELIPPAETTETAPIEQPPLTLLFAIPANDKLLRYWDTVADRLFKIRHCMNIEGVVRQLDLFEPALSVDLLVRGAAAGLDIGELLAGNDPSLPNYRFSIFVQKAMELCNELKSLGSTLLATLEKRDAEALSLLRSKHEIGLLEMVEQIREKQFEEAFAQHVALHASRDTLVGRLSHYQKLLGDNSPKTPAIGEKIQERDRPRFSQIVDLPGVKMFPHEILENTLHISAFGLDLAASSGQAVATALSFAPETNLLPFGTGVSFPGPAKPAEAGSKGLEKLSSISKFSADLVGRTGSYIVRELDWVFQHNQTAREIMQIDKQIVASEIRSEIARLELRNHRKQMENARAVDDFMHSKFSNQDLYAWMVGQISGIYFQTYQLAFDTAKRAERCYQHELGIKESKFIQFGYWDSLKKGLLAGEKLALDLKRLEMDYHEQNKREFELTKYISLLQLDPLALIQLRTTGECDITLPEALFDMDCPGHYFRRIKNVSVSIPCVTGPYTSVNCTLTLKSCRYRNSTSVDGAYAEVINNPPAQPDKRFTVVDPVSSSQVIVTSNAQNDSGLFETNFRDERYLPFEGLGVISTWKLSLPTAVRQFDYDTISDVILHIRYTAKDGGDALRTAAIRETNSLLAAANAVGSTRLFSIRHEFPTEWARFLGQPANGNNRFALTLNLREEHYPFWSKGRLGSVKEAVLIAKTTAASIKVSKSPDGSGDNDELKDTSWQGLLQGKLDKCKPNSSIENPLRLFLDSKGMDDLWLAIKW